MAKKKKGVAHAMLLLLHRFQELAQTGVRWVYRGGNTKFSDDLEPEYVTLNDDQTKAFVGFQVKFASDFCIRLSVRPSSCVPI